MTKTFYHNASGLPDDEQVTTARDEALLGRAIQERFPKYYAYFSTPAFRFRGSVIRNHNHLIGRVDGVDGIKTGYTRASGFNLVTSIRRGNRHLVAVVLGGRSAGTRDAAMRELIAEYIDDGATRNTASVIDQPETRVADAAPAPKAAAPKMPTVVARPAPKPGPMQLASAGPDVTVAAPSDTRAPAAAPEPMLLSSGVVAEKALPPVPGSSAPIKPTPVKTVVVRAGAVKTASAAPSGVASALPAPIVDAPATAQTASIARNEMPRQPANFGTGQGILGVLPASAMAYADARSPDAPRGASAAVPTTPAKQVVRSGWIVQVGAYDDEREARQRLDLARGRVKQLGKADPFTEPVVTKGDKTMYRARFAGLDKDDAEAACRALKRNDISCFTLKN
jgi:D-alanyl-D-alanine carboxypeptidase